MIKGTLIVHEKTRPGRFLDDNVNKKDHHLFKEAHEKALTRTYTDLYQMVE